MMFIPTDTWNKNSLLFQLEFKLLNKLFISSSSTVCWPAIIIMWCAPSSTHLRTWWFLPVLTRLCECGIFLVRAWGQQIVGQQGWLEEGVGGLRGMMDEEEAGAGFILSPASPLLPLLLVEDKSVWALCRNTSPFRKDRRRSKRTHF